MSCVVFFFKQKTAYEMRISDWSSDVCSSDLQRVARGDAPLELPIQPGVGTPTLEATQDAAPDEHAEGHAQHDERGCERDRAEHPGQRRTDQQAGGAGQAAADPQLVGGEAAHNHGIDRKSTRLNSSHYCAHRMPSTARTKTTHT